MAVYNHWTGLVDWTGGLDWLTDAKNHFYAFNITYLPVELRGNPVTFSLRTQSRNREVRPTIIVKVFVLSNVMALSLHML